jgi:hypothetical protein
MICKKCGTDKPETEEHFYRRCDNGRLSGFCRECLNKGQKQRYQNNKKQRIDYQRNWHQNHPDYGKEYYHNNKEQRLGYDREWRQNNPGYSNRYKKKRKEDDPVYKLIYNIRIRVLKALERNQKSGHTIELLGCTGLELKMYLESKFLSGMTWENHGNKGWHIDHIKPCASFDLSKPEEQRKCFHYTNLQPLWWMDNMSKGGR